jgi:SAM-dependent methyltransferase
VTYLDDNRDAWNKRAGVHVGSSFYDVAGFLAGRSSLKPPELALVGDVAGRRLLHLQCHFGLDTLSWARRGAVVTGVDLSDVALAEARALRARADVPAEFVQADVQAIAGRFAREFDVAIATYGVLCWLEDLDAWAAGIRASLRPGGRFVLVEFHPVLDVLFDGKISGTSGYFTAGPRHAPSTGTYTDPAASIEYVECRWQHSLADVATALIAAGLTLVDVREYPFSSYRLLDRLDLERDGVWYATRDGDRIPYMFSMVAEAR